MSLVLVLPAGPTGAQDGGDAPLPPLAELQALHPALDDVAVSSPGYDAARADVRAATGARDTAKRRRRAAVARLGELRATEVRLDEDLVVARSRATDARRRLRRRRAELRDLAVGYYVSGKGALDSPLRALDIGEGNQAESQRVLTESVNDHTIVELRAARRDLDRAETDIELTTAALAGVRADIDETNTARDEAAAQIRRADRRLLAAGARVSDERRLATVDATGLSMVVLDAYVKAARRTAALEPGCGIGWWALAGVGRTESGHGTFGGAEVRADGSLTEPIRGVPLTGEDGTARIPDTDDGETDGDPVLDRAVGPMQFIPSTWSRWGTDGNGDGRADPQNLYDAATAAALYLCASGPMEDPDGLRHAFFAYNHSLTYVATVLRRAERYRAQLSLGR